MEDDPSHVIFARTFETKADDYDLFVTEEDRFVAVVSKNHPLAKQPQIHLKELKDEKFVLLEKETLLHQPTLDLCQKAGFVPEILFQSARIDLLLNMVANELGVSILMEKTIEKNWLDSVAVLAITPTEVSQLAFMRKKALHSKASRLFWDYLQGTLPS